MMQLAICGVVSVVYELGAWGMDWIYRQMPLLCSAIGIVVGVGMDAFFGAAGILSSSGGNCD